MFFFPFCLCWNFNIFFHGLILKLCTFFSIFAMDFGLLLTGSTLKKFESRCFIFKNIFGSKTNIKVISFDLIWTFISDFLCVILFSIAKAFIFWYFSIAKDYPESFVFLSFRPYFLVDNF